jgi:hypothetical protein
VSTTAPKLSLRLVAGRRPALRTWSRPGRCRRPILRRPVRLRLRSRGRLRSPLWGAVLRRPILRRICRPVHRGPRTSTARRSTVIGRPIVWRPGVPRRPRRIGRPQTIGRTARTANGPRVPRSRPRPVNWPRRPVVRRSIAPVSTISRPVIPGDWPGPVRVMGGSIAASPSSPGAAIVVNLPSSPVPTPAAPTPGLAHQQGSDSDRNPKSDQPRARSRRVNHGRIVLRDVHHLWIHRLNDVGWLSGVSLNLYLLLRGAA